MKDDKESDECDEHAGVDTGRTRRAQDAGADESEPDGERDKKDETAQSVPVESGEIRHGGQFLCHGPSEIDGRENKHTRGLDSIVHESVGVGERAEAEHGDEKYEHVGVVDVVARAA